MMDAGDLGHHLLIEAQARHHDHGLGAGGIVEDGVEGPAEGALQVGEAGAFGLGGRCLRLDRGWMERGLTAHRTSLRC